MTRVTFEPGPQDRHALAVLLRETIARTRDAGGRYPLGSPGASVVVALGQLAALADGDGPMVLTVSGEVGPMVAAVLEAARLRIGDEPRGWQAFRALSEEWRRRFPVPQAELDEQRDRYLDPGVWDPEIARRRAQRRGGLLARLVRG